MEYFNTKTGLLKTKYKVGKYVDEIFCIYLYLYIAIILKQVLDTFDQMLYYGNVRVSKIHPIVEKLYRLYSFWVNYSHVAKLDYYLNSHIPFTKKQVNLFGYLCGLVNLLDLEKCKYAKLYYNLNVSEILMHDYSSVDMVQLPKMTIDGKLQFIYTMRKILPTELLVPIEYQCQSCRTKPISGLTLKRHLK